MLTGQLLGTPAHLDTDPPLACHDDAVPDVVAAHELVCSDDVLALVDESGDQLLQLRAVTLLGEDLGMKPIRKLWPEATTAKEIDE